MICHVILRSQDFKILLCFRFLEIIWGNWRFFGMFSTTGDLCESLSIFAWFSNKSSRLKIQREIPKEMAMFMSFSTMKRNMLVVYHLTHSKSS